MAMLSAVLALALLGAPAPASGAPCNGPPPGDCICNGDFETGNIGCWNFASNCAGAACSDQPCAVAIAPAADQGCTTPGSCCCIWSPGACPALFNVVLCGSFSAQIFSGEQAGGCGGNPNNWGELSQTVALPPGGAQISLWYAHSQEVTNAGWAEFAIDLGGACGAVTVWTATANVCTPWTFATANVCGSSAGCTVTIRARSVSQGALCTWAYLDDVFCDPCVVPPTPTPTPTRTPTPSPTPPTLFRMAVYAENGEAVRQIVHPMSGIAPAFSLHVSRTNVTFPDENGSATVQIAFDDTWVVWNGTGEDGRPLAAGTYLLRAWTYSGQGVLREEVVPLYVYWRTWPLFLRLYSPSGERVREIEGQFLRAAYTGLVLRPDPFSAGDSDPVAGVCRVVLEPGSFVPLRRGLTGDLVWDGRDDRGRLVANGTYLAEVEWMDPSGRRIALSSPVTVLSRNRALVKGASLAPNPVLGTGGGVSIELELEAACECSLDVLDVSGALVARVAPRALRAAGRGTADPAERVRWDLRRSDGGRAASGVYVGVLRARAKDGRSETVRLPFAILGR